MLDRIRLLPVVIIAAALLLGVKVGNIWVDTGRLIGVPQAYASNAAKDAAPAEASKGEMPKAEPGTAKAEPAAAEGEAAAPASEPKTKAEPFGSDAPSPYTKAELEILQNLSKRREELEARTKELDMRENLLRAAEERINGKIADLKKIEATVQALIGQHDEEEERQLKSLVKVYEKMKPKDAARILEKLDMDILISVTARMREANVAKIMAQMDAAKAKALTVELATRRRLPGTPGQTTDG